MKKIRQTVRQLYVRPTVEVVKVETEGNFLAESPLVRPGGGGTTSHPGSIQVVPPTEEDGGDDDNLAG